MLSLIIMAGAGIGIACWLDINTFLKSVLKTDAEAGVRRCEEGRAEQKWILHFLSSLLGEKKNLCEMRNLLPVFIWGEELFYRELFSHQCFYSITELFFFMVLVERGMVKKCPDSLQFNLAQKAKKF